MSDALVSGLAGATGGIVAQLLTYPLQTVNTRQQTERKARTRICEQLAEDQAEKGQGLTLVAADVARNGRHGTLHRLWQIVQLEGWSGLYRGLQPSLIGTAASQGVYYFFYQLFQDRGQALALQQKKAGKGDGRLGTGGNLLVAALAGFVNVLLTNPIWIIVTRMQTQSQVKQVTAVPPTIPLSLDKASSSGSKEDERPLIEGSRQAGRKAGGGGLASAASQKIHPPRQHQGAVATMGELHREAGVLGFWKGVFPALVMVSNPAMQFAIYEGLLARITAKRPPARGGAKSASAAEIFLLGAVAKLGATVVTYPLLVVKSRLQARQDIGADSNTRYSGTLDAILKMLRYEGISGFYKGMSTKIMQSVFAAAVLFLTKEELVKLTRMLLERREKLQMALTLRTVA